MTRAISRGPGVGGVGSATARHAAVQPGPVSWIVFTVNNGGFSGIWMGYHKEICWFYGIWMGYHQEKWWLHGVLWELCGVFFEDVMQFGAINDDLKFGKLWVYADETMSNGDSIGFHKV